MSRNSISLQIGQIPALVHSYLKKYSKPCPENEIAYDSSIKINLEKSEHSGYKYVKDVDLRDIMDLYHNPNPFEMNENANDYDGECGKITDISNNYNAKGSNMFDKLEFIDSQLFYDTFVEDIRKTLEKCDLLAGFHVISETHSSGGLACSIICQHLEDVYRKKFKILYGIYDAGDKYDDFCNSGFVNSYLTIDALRYSDTLLIPLTHLSTFGHKPPRKVFNFNYWSDYGHQIDLNDANSRSALFAYVISSFTNVEMSTSSPISEIVDLYIDATRSSTGALCGVRMFPLNPMNKSDYYFGFLGSNLDNSPNLCFTPGLDQIKNKFDDLRCQVFSLNDYPDLLNPQSQNSKVLKDLSRLLKSFDPRQYSKESMLDAYVSQNFPGSLSVPSVCDVAFTDPINEYVFPSLTSFFCGPSLAQYLRDNSTHMTRFYQNFPLKSELHNIDFSQDKISECLNQYRLKIEDMR